MLFFVLFMSFWVWARRLGGLGLVLLGLLDNSPVPLPGSVDALTMVLATQERAWWPYYAVMAVLGSLVGAYMAYAIGAEGGKELLEKKLPKKKAEKVYSRFQKHGFWALFIPALLPPPFPFSPFPIAAGVLKYNRRDFFLAVGLARSVRYGLLAYLGSRYSKQILGFFGTYYMPLLWTVIALAVCAGIALLIWRWKSVRKGKAAQERKDVEVKAA
jgi:membrane protein YqaA with SNARE-associated domain